MAIVSDIQVDEMAPFAAKPVSGKNREYASESVNGQPYSLNQELTAFGKWTSDPIWVPPNDATELAKSMLDRFGPFASKSKCWDAIEKAHRSEFTQVREIELPKASIRLPKGRLYVTITEQADFDTIEDTIPACVQTRLDEFMAGPGKKRGVKVYYLKPLCVEDGNQLIFTTTEQVKEAIEQVQAETFAMYRRGYLGHRAKRTATTLVNAGLAIPRAIVQSEVNKKRREIETYHQKLEFERRQRALAATRAHQDLRSDGCTFDEMLAMMDAPDRQDVIDHYVTENEKSGFDRQMFLIASAATLPWFISMSLSIYNLIQLSSLAAVAVCDPAFVAEMPGSNGELLKIGHFDEVDGVTHVEI